MRRILVLSAVGVAASAGAARGDVVQVAHDLSIYAEKLASVQQNLAAYDHVNHPHTGCFDVLAGARADGIPGSERVQHREFRTHPRARKVQVADQAVEYAITLDQARWYCQMYRDYARVSLAWDVFDRARLRRDLNEPPRDVADDARAIKALAEECRATWDELKADGVAYDLAIDQGQPITFGEIRDGICDALDAKLRRAAKARAADTQSARKKYAAAGISGKKLEILLENAGVTWRVRGGQTADEPRRLAAASVLFHWIEAADPDPEFVIHTIRRYQFKRNKLVKRTEKTYRKRQGAALGNVFK